MTLQNIITKTAWKLGFVCIPEKDRDNFPYDEGTKTSNSNYTIEDKEDKTILMSDNKYYKRDYIPETQEYILDSTVVDQKRMSAEFVPGVDDRLIKEHNEEQEQKAPNSRIKLKISTYKALKPLFAKGLPYKGKKWRSGGGEQAIRDLKGAGERSRAEYWKVFKKSEEIEIRLLSDRG